VNAKLEPFAGQPDLAATHVIRCMTDLLHFPIITTDGMQYLLVCIDEFTRYAFVSLLARKSDATEHLLRIMKRAHVLHGVRVKNLRTDCGGEFHNTVMRLMKQQSLVLVMILYRQTVTRAMGEWSG
jgi:hypothetical protein